MLAILMPLPPGLGIRMVFAAVIIGPAIVVGLLQYVVGSEA